MLYLLSVLAGKVYRKLISGAPHEKLTTSDYHKEIIAPEHGNSFIEKKIEEGTPFMAARLGSNELALVRAYVLYKKYHQSHFGIKLKANFQESRLEQFSGSLKIAMQNNAGFFPITNALLEKYAELILEDIKVVDLIGVWHNLFENTLLEEFGNEYIVLTKLHALEPYYHQQPWSTALAGKTALVIHPYEESIRNQYAQREKLFPRTDVLPAFELKTIKAVQSIAGAPTPFSTWFDALAHMKTQMEATDFDVLIVGAGAYGFHLAAHAKRLGKQAIHMGGATQILFGIKGARWDQHPVISKLYNEHWTRPLPSERPEYFNKVEGGCYW